MRILVCNYEYPPLGGGGGVTTKLLAEELAKRHSVTVLTSGFSGACWHEELNGVDIYRVPVLRQERMHTASLTSMLLYWPASVRRGLSICKRKKFDVLHAHFAIPTGPSSLMLAKLFGIPHVLSIHGGDLFDPTKKLSPHRTWGLHYTVQMVINRSDRVLAQSSNTRSNAYRYFKVNKPIEIVPHGIKRPSFLKRDRHSFGFADDDTLLITIGRLIPRKGIPTLISMMSRLSDKKTKLIILGDGPEKARLEEEVARGGLSSRITFKGRVSDEEKFQLLTISDLYVSSSLHEGFGLIFIEAMACGLPIVTFDNGGHTDFLINGKTGYLVPVGDLNSLCDKVALLCSHLDLRRAAGRVNSGLAENYYMENCAAQHEKVFEEVVRNGFRTA